MAVTMLFVCLAFFHSLSAFLKVSHFKVLPPFNFKGFGLFNSEKFYPPHDSLHNFTNTYFVIPSE